MYLKDNNKSIMQISNLYMPSMGGVVKDLIIDIFLKIAIVLVILAALDYFIQFMFHRKDLMMTKQEIKEE